MSVNTYGTIPSSSIELSRTFTSFAGVDIRAVINGIPIGQLQGISYAVQREKAPIYVMGMVDPLAFSRGKRGIAGTLIALLLDQHLLVDPTGPFGNGNLRFIADNNEIFARTSDLNNATDTSDLEGVDTAEFAPGNLSSNFTLHNAWYVDQVPPFDVVIVAGNEYGKAATMRIYGIEILNEGSGFSIDDVQIESQMTYVCRTILPWQSLGSWDMTTGAFRPTTS